MYIYLFILIFRSVSSVAFLLRLRAPKSHFWWGTLYLMGQIRGREEFPEKHREISERKF